MGDMSYAPIYEEWADLMRVKDTPEKQVAFMEGILRYAFDGESAPSPKDMAAPRGVDYARYDGYIVCRKTMDRMRKSVAAGRKGGASRRPKAAAGSGGDSEGAADAADAPGQGAAADGFDAGRSCASPQLPTESEMMMFAANVGVPKAYIPKFLARQREIGWEYVNHAGSVVRLSRRNFKSVLRLFWEREERGRRAGAPASTGGAAQPEGVVLKGEMVNDYGF